MTGRKLGKLFAFTLLLWCAATAALYASGGIYFDDFTVANNHLNVFFDNFDDGSISDWGSRHDAALSSAQSYSGSKSLYLNYQGISVADAFHNLSITSPGVVEVSARVWLPPVIEQRVSFTNLYLYSGNTSNNLYAGVKCQTGETNYRIWLASNEPGGQSVTTNSAVLAPQTWALFTLQMNCNTSIARAFLNGQQLLSIPFIASNFTSFDNVSAWGWLGTNDSVVTPEPSSIMALICGVCGLVWFRKR